MPPKKKIEKKKDVSISDENLDDIQFDDFETDSDDEQSFTTETNEPEIKEKPTERYEYKPKLETEIVFVSPENRITSEIMMKFEYTEVISHRAKQIENGGICFTNTDNVSDPLEMAKKELRDKKCPLDIIRMLTDKIGERWHVNEMTIPEF